MNRRRALKSARNLEPVEGPADTKPCWWPYHLQGNPESVERMKALDHLPNSVRVAIYYGNARHDPREVQQRMTRGSLSEQDTFQLVVRTDAWMTRNPGNG